MTKMILTVTSKPPFRDIKGRFHKAEKALLNEHRKEMRNMGRRYVKLAKEEAPKKTRKFENSIRFRTFQEGNRLGFVVTSAQPLGRFITKGTRPHYIFPRRPAWALRFVISGETIFARKVRHPGTKPNRFHGRAYRRWIPGARRSLNQISREFERELS